MATSTSTSSKLFEKIVYTFLISMLVWSSLFAQEATETTMNMSLGPQNGYYVDIDGVDKKFVEKVWDNYLKDQKYGKTKYNKKAKEHYGNEIKIGRVNGSSEFSLYGKMEEKADIVTVSVWADLGGYFINSEEHKREAEGLKTFLEEFYLQVKREDFNKELKDQEKTIKKAEKQQEKLKKKNESLHNDIKKLEQKILDKEKDIEENIKEQEEQLVIVEREYEKLEEIKEKINTLGRED